jgi:hypothetical protein
MVQGSSWSYADLENKLSKVLGTENVSTSQSARAAHSKDESHHA